MSEHQPQLSIVCVTNGAVWAIPFLRSMWELSQRLKAELVLACDGEKALDYVQQCGLPTESTHLVHSEGYIESVLDDALEFVKGEYVLRLDDDEKCSAGMVRWLEKRCYETANQWHFRRVHLWINDGTALVTPQLWPDPQIRLSVRQQAGGRYAIHCGSPWGWGIFAPVVIEHHKFLVRPIDDRREIVFRYDSIQEGAGSNFRPYSVPEDFYTEEEIKASLQHWDGEELQRPC